MEAGAFYLGDARILGGEGRPRMRMAGGRFHYAIQYELPVEGGRLGSDAAVWMGSLYRARKFTLNQLPYHEWFSERPIPVSDSKERNIVLPESPDREER